MSQEQSQLLMVCHSRTMSRIKVVVWALLMGMVAAKSESSEKPPNPPLLLHPSLSSQTYLNMKPPAIGRLVRKAKKTNFQAIKEALLLQNESDHLGDNLALETVDAPYQNLLESYPASAHPVSLYATHTYVPPIKNLFPSSQNSIESVKPFNLTESARTSDKGNQLVSTAADHGSITKDNDDKAQPGEIISLGRTLDDDEKETTVDVTDPFEGAEAEEETDFQPSNPAPYFYNGPQLVKPRAPINTLALDSNFGVAVTPIQVDTNGLRREVSNEIPNQNIQKLPQAFYLTKPKDYQYPSQGYLPYRRRPLPRVKPETDQVALEGYDRQVVFDRDPVDSPAHNSLLYLSPSGPTMPVVHKLRHDLGDMMTFMMNGPVRDFMDHTHSLASNNRTPMMARVGNALQKMMGGHMGDRSFDVFDWIPLIALIVATAFILSGLFPTGLGLNNGNVILGRRNGRVEGDKESILDQTLGNLETGVLMMSALRTEDGCSARLACRLGQAARQSNILKSGTMETLFEGIHTILPERFSTFARSFKKVAKDEDDESCHQECYRCIAI